MKGQNYEILFFKIVTFLIFFELFSIVTLPAQSRLSKKSHIAVLNFKGKGVSKTVADLLTERFRGELVNTNSFVVLERGRMDEILSEFGFQMSGCTGTSCAIEAGKILNVKKIIAGSIGKIGETYTVNLSLIDIETSQIEKYFNRDYQGKIDGLLKIFKEVAFNVAGKKIISYTKYKNNYNETKQRQIQRKTHQKTSRNFINLYESKV